MNIEETDKTKGLVKARNMIYNDRIADMQTPMMGNFGWRNYKNYLNSFTR